MHEDKYKIVVPLMYADKKKTTFIGLKLKNRPEVIGRITDVLADANVNVLNGIHSVSEDRRFSYWIFIADLSNAKLTTEEIMRRIRSMDDVISLDHGIRWFNNLGLPSFSTELTLMGEKVVIWRGLWATFFFRSILDEFKEGGEAFMYHVGRRAGHMAAKWWLTRTSICDVKRLLKLALEIWRALGWIKNYDVPELCIGPPKFLVILYGLYTCEPFRGSGDRPRGHLARGMLTGYLEEILGISLSSSERKCIARGDPFCEVFVCSEDY